MVTIDAQQTERRPHRNSLGFSLLELVFVIALTGLVLGMAMFNFRALQDPAKNAAQEVMGFVKQTRARALASTRAYTITTASPTQIVTSYGTSCTAPQTPDPALQLTLPDGAELDTLGWSVCYGTRGLANSSIDISISDATDTRTVQIALGGGVRVQ